MQIAAPQIVLGPALSLPAAKTANGSEGGPRLELACRPRSPASSRIVLASGSGPARDGRGQEMRMAIRARAAVVGMQRVGFHVACLRACENGGQRGTRIDQ